MKPSFKQSAAEWRQNWPVVITAFAGSALSSVHAYSLGVMIAPLEQEFGWTRAEITSGFFVVSVFAVSCSIFIGMLIDRVGPRRIALLGIVVYSSALALLSQATGSIIMWWVLWGLIAIGTLLITPTIWVAAVSSLFTASRGVALAVVLSATGFTSFLMPMLTLALLQAFDWRTAFLLLGGGSAAIVLPLVWLFFFSTKDRQRQKSDLDRQTAPALTGLTLRQGLSSANFYLLGAAGLVMSLASVALVINIVPILVSQGLTVETAAAVAGVIGISQIVGRLAGGYLLDRFNARLVAAVSVGLPVISCAILLTAAGSWPAAVLAVAFLGFAAGAEMDAVAYLAGRCFGMLNFGAIFGAFIGLITLGFGTGPMLANFVYDQTGSYDPVLWAVMPLAALSSVLFLKVGPYPDLEHETPAAH